MRQKGNSIVIAIIFVAIVLIIFMFMIAVYFGIVNSMVYNIKLDMYSINRSAIIAVNKSVTSRSSFSYDIKDYKEYLTKQIATNYNLNESLESKDGFVEKIELIEYEILKSGNKDKVTNKTCEDTVIHSLIKVKVKPFLFKEILEKVCTFEIHEDVALNMATKI
jgi:hypothetical protein